MGDRLRFIETPLHGSYIVQIEPVQDERGLFARVFCQQEFSKIGFSKRIEQINHSSTRLKGAIRGLHCQLPPSCEIKIIRCIRGKVFDVMVDVRKASPSFCQWFGVELSDDTMQMVYIPEGFAHGFQTLTEQVELIYHHSSSYHPELEFGMRFDDPTFAIEWPLPMTSISNKDYNYPYLSDSFKGIEL